MKPTPPLMDSTMYFLSGDAIWETVSTARTEISSKVGTGGAILGLCAIPEALSRATKMGKRKTGSKDARAFMPERLCKGNLLYPASVGLSTVRI
jgi:hypothetical protein